MANYYDITLALAGVCQAAKLVQQLALNGDADQTALETSLNSLLLIYNRFHYVKQIRFHSEKYKTFQKSAV